MYRYSLLLSIAFIFFGSPQIRAQNRSIVGASSFRMGLVRVKIQSQTPVKLVSGEIPPLLDVKQLQIRYQRDSMEVCDYGSELAYLEHRCKDKDSATAESIRQKWFRMHTDVCEPSFEEYFNKTSASMEIMSSNYSGMPLPILLVEVIKEEPHHHTAVYDTPPYLAMECTFVSGSGRKLAVFEVVAIGSPKGDNQDRLRDCYSIAGKLLAKDLNKMLKKLD